MAQRVQVMLVDDIEGVAADETVTFALDGISYEIDLTTANAAELRDAFARYVGAARKISGRSANAPTRGSRPARSSRSADGLDTKVVREWARSHGHTVSERGRLSAEIVEKYQAANA